MVMKPTFTRVLMCGGPLDGQYVAVPAGSTTYQHMETSRSPSFLPDLLSLPTYTLHTYYLGVHNSETWVGIHSSIRPSDYARFVEDSVRKSRTLKPEYLSGAMKFKNIETDPSSLREWEMVLLKDPVLPDQVKKVGENPVESKKDFIRRICNRLPVDPLSVELIYNEVVASLGANKPAEPDDGLTHITIKTRKPDKWRFIDTETGETWRWDTENNKYVKVTYNHE